MKWKKTRPPSICVRGSDKSVDSSLEASCREPLEAPTVSSLLTEVGSVDTNMKLKIDISFLAG